MAPLELQKELHRMEATVGTVMAQETGELEGLEMMDREEEAGMAAIVGATVGLVDLGETEAPESTLPGMAEQAGRVETVDMGQTVREQEGMAARVG